MVIIIVNNLFTFLSSKYLIENDLIVNRRFWGIYEIYLLYMSFADGVISAFSRFTSLLKYALVSIYSFDKPIFADYILEFKNFDKGYKVFLGVLLVYHRYNHPVMITFANLLSIFRIFIF